MFPGNYDDDDDLSWIPEETVALVRQRMDDLTRETQKIGLHPVGFTAMAPSKDSGLPDDEPSILLFVNFTAGELAWSDKVQNPDKAAIDSEFRAIQREIEANDFEEYRRRLEERMRAEGEEEA